MLPQEVLSGIWTLSDVEGDGTLSLPEFVVAMHLVTAGIAGIPVPTQLPDALIQSVLHVRFFFLMLDKLLFFVFPLSKSEFLFCLEFS
jgi:hypothetical protein